MRLLSTEENPSYSSGTYGITVIYCCNCSIPLKDIGIAYGSPWGYRPHLLTK